MLPEIFCPDRETRQAFSILLSVLPDAVRRELLRLGAARRDFAAGLGELRLRAGRRASVLLSGKNLLLSSTVPESELSRTLLRAAGGVLYPYRDTLAAGYLPMKGGIRIGICGQARIDGGRQVGVGDIGALIFRMPGDRSDVADTLYEEYRRGVGRGMLIYSPPAGGKTTALRALARRIGSESPPPRLVIVDEREEFSPELLCGSSADILRGYPKAEGIALAVRTLSPELLMADEIGTADEADALLCALGVGVPLIATAHASSFEELSSSEAIRPLMMAGAFRVYAGILQKDGRRSLAVRRLSAIGGGR